jgi:hypothetical protein
MERLRNFRLWPVSDVAIVSFPIAARYFLVSKKEHQHHAGAHHFLRYSGAPRRTPTPRVAAGDARRNICSQQRRIQSAPTAHFCARARRIAF